MKWPANNSPIWLIIRVICNQIALIVALCLFYNYLDARDIKTLLLCLVADSTMGTVVGRLKNKIGEQVKQAKEEAQEASLASD